MKQVFIIFLLIISSCSFGHNYNNLLDASEHTLVSNAMGKTMRYSVYVPRTLALSEKATYPVAIVFDAQNTRGCINTVQALDYLMASFAMPDFIVVTIPQQNRFYETSVDLNREGSGGIDQFLTFILQELDSVLKTTYSANNYRLLIGHSRTAFLATYALAKHPNKVNGVIANSPFFIEPSKEPFINLVQDLESAFREVEATRYYSCSVGGAARDPHHKLVMQAEKKLEAATFSTNFNWEVKMYPAADHYTVVGLHTMNALAGFYSTYSSVLDQFVDADDKSKMDANWLKTQLQSMSDYYDFECVPQLVHLNSMASHFLQENEVGKAIEILEYGIEFYPKSTDLHAFCAMLYQENGNAVEAKKSYELALHYLPLTTWYSASELEDLKAEITLELKKVE